MDGFQFPDQKFTVTIKAVENDVVRGHERYYGTSPKGSWDKPDDFVGRLADPYTAVWRNLAGSTLIVKGFRDELAGVQNSVVFNACAPLALRRVGAK